MKRDTRRYKRERERERERERQRERQRETERQRDNARTRQAEWFLLTVFNEFFFFSSIMYLLSLGLGNFYC